MKALILTTGSLMLTVSVILNAYYQKNQFYPSVVYITKSNPSMAVLYLQAFVFVILSGKVMRKIFFGQLRAAEMEHLIERSWYAVTETCLAFTVFRDDFSPRFVGLFTLLLFLKCFHWLAEDRVDYMERSPLISVLFHARVVSLLSVLGMLDAYFIHHAYYSTLIKGASVQLVFGFEYAILLTVVMTIFFKYILHTIDLQSENPWENKAVYMLYTDLVLGFIKVVLYTLFLGIMIKVHTFPLFAIRPMYLTIRAFRKALNDVIMSRRAIRNMNTLYADATAEELAAGDNVCIICREEMNTNCKKLPCNHIFHTSCLRSWFQRQQTCPTCRMDVLRPNTMRRGTHPLAQNQPEQAPDQQQQAQQQAQLAGMFPGFPGGFPMWPPQQPQAPPQPPSSTSTVETSATTSAATPGVAGEAGAGFAMPPPFMPMMPPFMPMMPPFGMAPPVPPQDFTGLTEDELRAMEGTERAHLEARITCLRDIHTLLDAAMLQIQQYTTVMASMGVNVSSREGQTMPSSATLASTMTTQSANAPKLATSSAPSISTPSTSTLASLATPSNNAPSNEVTSTDTDLGELEGAVGFSGPPTEVTIPQWEEEDGEDDVAVTRRRRLQRFASQSNPNTKVKDNIELD